MRPDQRLDGPTPHMDARRGDYAPTVLLPGDPKRARHIAETYLEDVRHVNDVRGADGFTGTFGGSPVSVQAVGMGVPSAAIYYTELIRHFGVERLIRIGSCGAIAPALELGDLVVASGAGTDSAAVGALGEGLSLALVPDWGLLRRAVDSAEGLGLRSVVGPVYTSDLFYAPDERVFDTLRRHGVLAIEMEAAGLYAVAAAESARALALLSVSDDVEKGLHLSPSERESGFDAMIRVALALAGDG